MAWEHGHHWLRRDHAHGECVSCGAPAACDEGEAGPPGLEGEYADLCTACRAGLQGKADLLGAAPDAFLDDGEDEDTAEDPDNVLFFPGAATPLRQAPVEVSAALRAQVERLVEQAVAAAWALGHKAGREEAEAAYAAREDDE